MMEDSLIELEVSNVIRDAFECRKDGKRKEFRSKYYELAIKERQIHKSIKRIYHIVFRRNPNPIKRINIFLYLEKKQKDLELDTITTSHITTHDREYKGMKCFSEAYQHFRQLDVRQEIIKLVFRDMIICRPEVLQDI